jgi:hypothetical protein
MTASRWVESRGRRREFNADMLELYHAEPVANSMKVLLCLKEKGLELRVCRASFRS